MSSKRNTSLDLLRIIASVGVVLIHTLDSLAPPAKYNTQLMFLSIMLRSSTLVFIMLAGTFILGNDKNGQFGYFYKKSWKHLGWHTLIFSAIYFVFKYVLRFMRMYINYAPTEGWLGPFKALLAGEPFYHMWYMYMLIPLYAVVPLLVYLRKSISTKNFAITGLVLTALGVVEHWRGGTDIAWSITSLKYVGIFIMGYVIRVDYGHIFKKARTPILLAVGLLFLNFVFSCVRSKYNLPNILLIPEDSRMNPIIILATFLLFAGFCKLETKRDYSKYVPRLFFVYLIHVMLLIILMWVLVILKIPQGNPLWQAPIVTVIVFAASYVLAGGYMKLYNKAVARLQQRRKVKVVQ